MPEPSRLPVWSRSFALLSWILVAAAPVAFMAARAIAASDNIVFWDDFDSALGFALQVAQGLSPAQFLDKLTSIDSEHRTLTSRLLVAAIYRVTGTLNFNLLAAIGNLALLGLCVVLIATAQAVASKIRLGVLLAFGLFHLGHYETFLWAGASIDHHTVLFLATCAIVTLARGGRVNNAGSAAFATLATFTLAHGCLVWIVGGTLLAHARRWRALVAWVLTGGVVLGFFFYGFAIDPAHRISDFSLSGIAQLFAFWLTLLGAAPTLGSDGAWAVSFGLGLLGLLAWLGFRGAWKREPIIMPLTVFAIAALGLIAIGRIEVAGEDIQSRYILVSSLAWTLTAYMYLERVCEAQFALRRLAWCLPALVTFNVVANMRSSADAATFLWSRVYPAIRFKQYGEEGHAGPFRLHPRAETVSRVLTEASARGIYELPSFCFPAQLANPQPNQAMVTYVTDLTANERTVGFEGWAMFPQRESERGMIYVVLRSENSTHVFSTVSVERRDVAKAFKEPLWRHCGYSFVLERDRLPAEDFQVGLVISGGEQTEFKMTDHWLRLSASARSIAD